MIEPHVGQRVRSTWAWGGQDLTVIGVSGHGPTAWVLIEVPVEDEHGYAVDVMTTTVMAEDLVEA